MYKIYLKQDQFEERLQDQYKPGPNAKKPSLGLVYVLSQREEVGQHWLWTSLVATACNAHGPYGLQVLIEEHNMAMQYRTEWSGATPEQKQHAIARVSAILMARADQLIRDMERKRFADATVERAYLIEAGMLEDLKQQELSRPEWWVIRSEINGQMLPVDHWSIEATVKARVVGGAN